MRVELKDRKRGVRKGKTKERWRNRAVVGEAREQLWERARETGGGGGDKINEDETGNTPKQEGSNTTILEHMSAE